MTDVDTIQFWTDTRSTVGWTRMAALRRAAIVGAALAVAATLGVAPTSAHPGGSSKGLIPVVACRTSSPLGKQAARYPKQMDLQAPASVRSRLSFYTDKYRSVTPILGPRGWACSVQLGEDGSGEVDVRPVGAGVGSKTAVTAGTDGACQGCVYDTVCKLIPGSGKQLGYANLPCTASLSKREHDKFLVRSKTYDVIRFSDAAHVKGTGSPSGGGVPAVGLLLYHYSHRVGGSASVGTCAVPASKRSLCSTILGRFRADKWRLS
jgi:hypothetical protein